MRKVARRLAGLFVFFSTIWFIMATPLLAEDIAHRRIIGFSPDGNYFAFEQSGIENGSREAYAHIFVIYTPENKWVKGSPFRVKVSGRRKLRHARRRVRDKARAMLQRHNIKRKGVVLASNPITEMNTDSHRVKVRTRRTIRRLDEPLVFSIEEVRLSTRRCHSYTRKPIKGMIIRVRRKGGRRIVLHEDRRIPESRGCPTSYGIEDVIRLKKRSGGAVYAVIYSFVRAGENGQERRFIAGGWHDDGGDYKEPDYYDEMYDYSGAGGYDVPLDRDDRNRDRDDRDADYRDYDRRGDDRRGDDRRSDDRRDYEDDYRRR